MIRLKNPGGKYRPEQAVLIMIEIRKSVDKFRAVVKNLRITEVAIEFDLFVVDLISKEESVKALTSIYGNVLDDRDLADEENSLSSFKSKEEIIALTIQLFNAQRYWECHEVCEQIWRREKNSSEKDLQQGVILAASALVHAQKGENDVCFGMLSKSLEKLSRWNEPNYFGLNVDLLKNHLKSILRTHRIQFQKI